MISNLEGGGGKSSVVSSFHSLEGIQKTGWSITLKPNARELIVCSKLLDRGGFIHTSSFDNENICSKDAGS